MYQQDIKEILQFKEYLMFYEVMKYPIPQQWRYFLCEKKQEETASPERVEQFSRNKKNPYMDEFVGYINKYSRLFKSIPYIQSIYLCNSLTFNAIKSDSDIDLFIITKKNSLRRARFRSVALFFIFGLKRTLSKKAKKFCLSFYVTEDHQNLYDISLPQTDIYLIYRLAHLVPLYHETQPPKSIYEYNTWIQTLLPNLPKQHLINIGTNITYGTSSFKRFREKWLGGGIGHVVEYLIKTIRLPIIIYKTKKLKEF